MQGLGHQRAGKSAQTHRRGMTIPPGRLPFRNLRSPADSATRGGGVAMLGNVATMTREQRRERAHASPSEPPSADAESARFFALTGLEQRRKSIRNYNPLNGDVTEDRWVAR